MASADVLRSPTFPTFRPFPLGRLNSTSASLQTRSPKSPVFATTTSSTPLPAQPAAPKQSGPPQKQTKICVYCGASAGLDPAHMEAARDLARVMAANNIALVYGGGTVGLMGELAKTLVSLSGPDSVHGIIPEALAKFERNESYGSEITIDSSGGKTFAVPLIEKYGRTTVVKDMHTRKHMMAQEVIEGGPGSGFVALSGGYGTLEELLETCTWNQLGIHDKGVVALNVNGFYDGILGWIQNGVGAGFIRQGDILVEAKSGESAVNALREYRVSEKRLKLAWKDEGS